MSFNKIFIIFFRMTYFTTVVHCTPVELTHLNKKCFRSKKCGESPNWSSHTLSKSQLVKSEVVKSHSGR